MLGCSVARLLKQTHRKLELYRKTIVPKAKEGVKSVMSEYLWAAPTLAKRFACRKICLELKQNGMPSTPLFRDQQLEHKVITNGSFKPS